MLATFNMTAFVGDTPPTLSHRKGQAHFESAKKDFGITIRSAREINPTWSQLSLDVSGSTPTDVYTFCQITHVASVTLQPADAEMYLAGETPLVRDMVKNNFPRFFSQELEPSEITEAFKRAVMACVTYTPPVKKVDDPESHYDLNGNYRGDRATRDAAYIEVQRQQEAAEKEAARTPDPLWL